MFKLLFVLALLGITPVYGYIDPGSGSFIFQILIAGIAGGIYAIKVFWRQIATFLSSIFKKGSK